MKKVRWICVKQDPTCKEPYFMQSSLGITKSESIRSFTEDSCKTWLKWREDGWRCIKVQIIINIITP